MARNLLALASILALASACAGPSATVGGSAPLKAQAGAAQPGVTTATPDSQKLICTSERPVGSNIPKKVCRTQEQIDRERDAAQDKMREMSQTHQKDFN
jgi:hypothetical protein